MSAMYSWFKPRSIDSLRVSMPRDELVRRSRILIVDDERPDLIDDLKRSHFAVDYEPDITPDNLARVAEQRIYDLVLLDFGQVGTRIGGDEGLSVLKHIKRVNPATIVLAYTSKALGTEHAEFFRLADGVLPKDAGIGASMEKIEEMLRRAHSIQNLWRGVLAVTGVEPNSKMDLEWQDLLVRGVDNKKYLIKLKQRIAEVAGQEVAEKIALGLIEKAVEISIKAMFTGGIS